MQSLDHFESVFKRAVREPYRYAEPALGNDLLVTDLPPADLPAYESRVKDSLEGLA